MKIQFIASDYHGCGFYRMMIPCQHLAELGHETIFDVKDKRFPSTFNKTVDVTVVQWNIDPVDLEEFKNLKSLKVYELDDYFLGNNYIDVNSDWHKSETMEIVKEFIRSADLVTVTTEPLKKAFTKYNKNIAVLPNCIDFRVFNKDEIPFVKKKWLGNKVVIGFIGSFSHFLDLEIPMEAVAKIMEDYDNVYFCLIGWDGTLNIRQSNGLAKFDILKKLPKERVIIEPWTEDFKKHANNYGLLDILIAPLLDTEFNRCKSDLKLLEAASMGVPVLASDVYPFSYSRVFAKLVKTKGNVYHSWLTKLKELVEEPDAREFLSESQYEDVKQFRDIKNNIHLWEDVYKKNLK